METIIDLGSVKQEAPEELPSLLQHAASETISGFDNVEVIGLVHLQSQQTCSPSLDPSPDYIALNVDASQINDIHHVRAISISMPSSPFSTKRVQFNDAVEPNVNNGVPVSPASSMVSNEKPKQAKFYSQPMPRINADGKASFVEPKVSQHKNPRINRLKDKRYDSFKTWSGKLERQISVLRGKPQEIEPELDTSQGTAVERISAQRYFDALEGPELETLKPSEELLLPEDKQWPFLLRFPISTFGICLGTSSQAILWKSLATSPSTSFLNINLDVNLVLWCISVAVTVIIASIYSLKIIFYFEAIRREYYHPIRVNFFFAPWIAVLFLALGAPPSVVKNLHTSLWYILMIPIFCLELKIYGQWMSGGRRRLSKVANPSNHLAVVGNFVGALLGASMGLKEGPIFFFAVGMAHYIVLFVTLYQRLPTNETLPKELHPVFFLFVAAPSVASMAWARIQGTFDYGSRISYFIALFLYFSLAVRINFFRGIRFSLTWWAYTFPMTGAAIATIRYSNEVKNPVTQSLSVILSAISTLTVTALLVSTILHAFVMRNLFPNDISIAISRKRVNDKKHVGLISVGSDTKAVDHSLKSASSVEP